MQEGNVLDDGTATRQGPDQGSPQLPSATLGGGWLAPREMWGGVTKVSYSGQHSQTNHEPYTARQKEVLEHPKTSQLL